MFIKILQHIDKKHFGDKAIVYTGKIRNENVYIVIEKDREEIVNFIVDDTLTYMYPCMVPEFKVNLNNPPQTVDMSIDIDLSRYGKGQCPEYLKRLITEGKSNF